MNRWLRWSALIPATIVAWLSVLIIGTFAHGYIERTLCPPEDVFSGACTNTEVRAKLALVTAFFAGLSAIAVVLSAAVVAPSAKRHVAWVAVAVGGVVALAMVDVAPESISAIVSGVVTAAVISRRA